MNRTHDNKIHEVMMSGRCRCGEPSPCLRRTLAEQLDSMEFESGVRFSPDKRRVWLDMTEILVRKWHKRMVDEIADDQGRFVGYACMDCGRAVQDWAAGDDEWAKVMAPENGKGHICSDCFMRRAWHLDMHLHLVRYCEDGEE